MNHYLSEKYLFINYLVYLCGLVRQLYSKTVTYGTYDAPWQAFIQGKGE